ncbi:hypothetical protein V3C33_13310 [Micrococcaceae bacterium Sec5.7]
MRALSYVVEPLALPAGLVSQGLPAVEDCKPPTFFRPPTFCRQLKVR